MLCNEDLREGITHTIKLLPLPLKNIWICACINMIVFRKQVMNLYLEKL